MQLRELRTGRTICADCGFSSRSRLVWKVRHGWVHTKWFFSIESQRQE